MNAYTLSSVSYTDNTYKVSDFNGLTDKVNSTFTNKDTLGFALGINVIKTIPNTFKVVKLYGVNDRVLVFTKESTLYDITDRELKGVCFDNFSSPPDVVEFNFGGRSGIAVIGDGVGKIITKNAHELIGLPKGDTYVFYKGAFFIGQGRKITILRKLDYFNKSFDTSIIEYVTLPAKLGSVIKLILQEGKLVAFCTRGIAEISVSDTVTEYSIEVPELPPIKCDAQTVKKVGDAVYFINSWQGLCYYKNKSIHYVDSTLISGKNLSPSSEAVCVENCYLLPLTDEMGNKRLFLYDANDKKETFIDADSLLVCEGGYVFNHQTNEYGKVCYNPKTLNMVWQSKRLDLGTDKTKTLYKVSVYASASGVFKILGKHGSRTFPLAIGQNVVKTCVVSDEFIFAIESEDINFTASGLAFKYRV